MARDIMNILGQRLVSDSKLIMYKGFPESDDIQVLPAGQPSPKITSYLPKGWFQLEGGPDSNWYVKDEPKKLQVVPADTPDQSSLYGRFESAFSGFFSNVSKDVSANAGYLSEGFKKSVDELKIDAFNLGKYFKQILLLIVILAGIWLVSQFTN